MSLNLSTSPSLETNFKSSKKSKSKNPTMIHCFHYLGKSINWINTLNYTVNCSIISYYCPINYNNTQL